MIRPKRAFIIGLAAARHQAERGLQVDADHLIPFLVLHPHRQIVARDAGIVDENIELAAKRLDRRGHQRIDRGGVGQIARQGDMIAAEFGAKRLELLGIGPGNRQPRALRGQRLGDRRTDPARSAGDQRGHACEVEHSIPQNLLR